MDERTRRELSECIRYATLAPSTHNTQPWKFAITEEKIHLIPDLTRRLPILDPEDRELSISLGCALENLRIALDYYGYGPKVTLLPENGFEECAEVSLKGGRKYSNAALFEAILDRQTNRSEYQSKTIPQADLNELKSIPLEEGVAIYIVDDKSRMLRVLRHVTNADLIQMGGNLFREELIQWLRFNESEAKKSGDGLGAESIGMRSGPRWLGSLFLKHVNLAEMRADRDEVLLQSSPAIALFTTNENNKRAWLRAGMCFERFALTVCHLGIQLAHMNQPIEIEDMRPMITGVFESKDHPQLLVRMGYAMPMPYSRRRNVEDVLVETISTLFPGRQMA